jgi:membrane protease YdiL (CAAX protease family)
MNAPLPPVAPEPGLNGRLFKNTLWVWFFTILAIRLFHELQSIPLFQPYVVVLTALLLIYIPIFIFYRRREPVQFLDGSPRQFLISLGWFLAVSLVIFPLLEFLNRYFQDWVMGKHFVGGHYRGLLKFFFFHLVAIAFPEEIFYRAYLQPQFNRVWGRPWHFLGTPFGKSLLFTSFLFALSHSLIQLQWWHFSIFFPSLVFGWLREKTGTVTAGTLFHALSNTYSYWVFLNYR